MTFNEWMRQIPAFKFRIQTLYKKIRLLFSVWTMTSQCWQKMSWNLASRWILSSAYIWIWLPGEFYHLYLNLATRWTRHLLVTPSKILNEHILKVWRQFPDRIVGFPSRTHFWQNSTARFLSKSFSDTLTQFFFFKDSTISIFLYQLPIRVGVDERAVAGVDGGGLLPLLLALPLHSRT